MADVRLNSLLSFIIGLILLQEGRSQAALSNYACEFKVAYIRQISANSRIDMIILTESVSPVQFSVSSLNGSIDNGTTTRDTPAIVTLPSTLQVRETTYDYRQLGLLVTSSPDKPISVVLVGWTGAGPSSTYLALPCIEQPVQEYVYYGVSANNESPLAEPFDASIYSQVVLVGCRDNTTVTITPTHDVQLPDNPQSSTSSIINVAAGSSHTITLHSLQTLLIGAPNVDLSGTKIVSNYPLTVVGGHDCGQVPSNSSYLNCDPFNTQIPPTVNWGTRYLLTPLSSRTNGQRFATVASQNGTLINIMCTPNLLHEIDGYADETEVVFLDTVANQFCFLECSKPCYVSEFGYLNEHMSSSSYGDPILMSVPAISQYPHSVTFTTLPDMPTNFYSIAVPADSYYNGTVIINGSLTTLNWTPIRDTNGAITGYGYNTTANGSYTISHSHPNGRIYVSAYGFSQNGGYGYLTGTLLNPMICVPMFKFNSSTYTAIEGSGKINVFIQRLSSFFDSVIVSSNGINETVAFAPGEAIIAVPILDNESNDYTEDIEYSITVTLHSVESNPICRHLDTTTVIVKDDDYLAIGVNVNEGMDEVRIGVAVHNGILGPGHIATILLQLQSPRGQSLTSILQFSYSISSYTVSYNITKLATELSLTNDEPVNVTALLLPFDEEGPLVSISPSAVNFTLFDTSYTTSTSPFVSTVYVTVEPTNNLFSQAIGNTYTIIGASALVVLALVFTALCIVALIISYKCGKRKQVRKPFRERSSTELIPNRLYKSHTTSVSSNPLQEYIELNDVKNTNAINRLSEVNHTDAAYASIRRETKTDTQGPNEVTGVDTIKSRVYTSLDPATMQQDYDAIPIVRSTSNFEDNTSIESSYEEVIFK